MIEVGLVGGVDGKIECVYARVEAVSWNSIGSRLAKEADQQGEDQKGHAELDGRNTHYDDQTKSLCFLLLLDS